MADITNQHDESPPELEDAGNGAPVEARGIKRARTAADDDDDDDEKGGRERRKIEIKFITDKSRRHITFSKRKAGIMKKAYELSVLTGTQVLLLVVSETGLVYTFTTPKLQPLVTKAEGKNLIQACLNAPEVPVAAENGVEEPESPEESPAQPPPQAHMSQAAPPRQTPMPAQAPMGNYLPQNMSQNMQMDPMAYQTYLQQQQRSGQYPIQQQGMPQHQQHQA